MQTSNAAATAGTGGRRETSAKHPPGLYVLFATEMWERFSFYSMLALFTLYMRDSVDGFGWSAESATGLYANYMMFVYASPLIGGIIADKKLGYRRAVMLGGLFFMAGHALLSFRSLPAVYAALTCLVIGNGLFKPNVSTMVGNLYAEGAHLKDRAYNIFYMGINVGAFLAPVVMEMVKSRWGYHPAFAVAAFGMVISVGILWWFRSKVEDSERGTQGTAQKSSSLSSQSAASAMDAVPEWKRIAALIVIFAIVIVFWMVFHQNGSTLTYWADDNTDWNVSGTISNAINPFWIIALTFPLIGVWKWLDQRGKEPSTPAKMAIGMLLTGLSFFILFIAARTGEGREPEPANYAQASFRVTDRSIGFLRADGVPESVLTKLASENVIGKKLSNDEFLTAVRAEVGEAESKPHEAAILRRAYLFRVSAFWLILAYAVISLGELMLSPMGLSLVSKVAPIRMRGMMMGGWFVATALGNKLTMIGIYWERWLQSTFFLVLGMAALLMAVVLMFLLKPLKKAMPGV